ncbi:MAG: hypothetical protein M1586_01850 [Patescibacteria group bacterium]|nr:hypothetical protein [Patescibacteria group bacterium]MCL5262026.1 hypothetical protein [Patescibacteria group bacterium]
MDESLQIQNETERSKTIEAIKLSMAKEIDPQDPEVVVLAEKWTTLMDELGSGDGIISQQLRGLYSEDINDFKDRFGDAIPDDETLDYIRRALED